MKEFFLDTVTVSAIRLPARNPEVMRWLRAHQEDQLVIPVFVIGEIQQGIEMTGDVEQKAVLQEWLDDIRSTYRDQIIPFFEEEAKFWGSLVAPFQLAGRPPAVVDSMIAAMAMFHGSAVVTRNVRHFAPFGVPVVNPWDDENGA